MSDAADERIAELERAVARDPGGSAFAALAELHRRAGRLESAERVAVRGLAQAPESAAGRAVLALILADAGRDAELRRRLEGWAEAAVSAHAPLAPSPVLLPGAEALGASLSSSELDRAFADAETDREQMITPDSVAEEAALRIDGSFALESPLEAGGAFATRTMADLLERQGDPDGAARIRARLDGAKRRDEGTQRDAAEGGSAPGASRGTRTSTIAVLERWLGNARRMQS